MNKKKFTIHDLINKLNDIREEHGNLDVVVQFRDENIDLDGCDSKLYLDVCLAEVKEDEGNWIVKNCLVL
jgi:hypothetical protein